LQSLLEREHQLSPFPNRETRLFSGADLQHRLAVGFLQVFKLALGLIAHVFELGAQGILYAALAISTQLSISAGVRSNRRLAPDDLKDQSRAAAGRPTLDFFLHHFAHHCLLGESTA